MPSANKPISNTRRSPRKVAHDVRTRYPTNIAAKTSIVLSAAYASGTALAAILAGGHVLFEDVPGLGKTLAARSLSTALGLAFGRIQCTPDLLPADITGSYIYDPTRSTFVFREGPVFTGLLLADEINRTAPKTQSSLLEAMAERQVTVEGTRFPIPAPFHVLATSNPVEYEGTYPLPEAQLDRFLLKLNLPLPSREQEVQVIERHAAGFNPGDLAAAGLRAVAGPEELAVARDAVAKVAVSPEVAGYVVDLCRATRESPSLALGASPRGATALLATGRAWAWVTGRDYLTPDDVKSLALPTLRHRLRLRPEAEMEGVTADSVLTGILAHVPVPR
jgi:MoxR-like ATPase